MLKAVPVGFVIALPLPALKLPTTVSRLTPVVALFVLLIEVNCSDAVTVLRLTAGPPVASTTAVLGAASWSPVPPPALNVPTLDADRPEPPPANTLKLEKLRSPLTLVRTRPLTPTGSPDVP